MRKRAGALNRAWLAVIGLVLLAWAVPHLARWCGQRAAVASAMTYGADPTAAYGSEAACGWTAARAASAACGSAGSGASAGPPSSACRSAATSAGSPAGRGRSSTCSL